MQQFDQANIRYIKNNTKLYCSKCDNLIEVKDFRKNFHGRLIALDTSVIISRIVSKDMNSSQYFEGNTFILPSFVYQELDNKGPNLKKGGLSEISTLEDLKGSKLMLEKFDTNFLDPSLSNDERIISVIITKNAILLTKDGTMTSFAKISNLVFRVDGL